MMKFYRVFYSFILSRRYRITLTGVELLKESGSKLLLPNHQSHIDPQLIALEAYKHSDITPVVNARFYKIPVIKYFLRKWGAVAVSDLKSGNRDPNVLHNIFSGVLDALAEGKTVIIYPSGTIQESGMERVKNKQAAHKICAELPEGTKVIGLRIKGLWGSTFSTAWNGKRPKFLVAFAKGFGYFFANLIFLTPKRDVNFEFVDITKETVLQAKKERRPFNTYLEEFYNKDGAESPLYVKHFFFFPKSKRKTPENLRNSSKSKE